MAQNIKRLAYFATPEGDKRIGDVSLFTGVARAGLLEALVWGLTDAELINAAHRGEKKRQELLDGDKQKRAALLNQIKGMSVEQVEALMSSLKADQSKEAS
jgi:cell division FtsZ-interacting protein ZapD